MSNALMIDSFGSRSRRKRITASAQREGSAPSFAQRSASLASIVIRCRLSPRRSRTITSKVNPLPERGVTVTEGSLISYYPGRLIQNHRTTAENESGPQALGCSDEILQKKLRLRHACCARVHKDQRGLRVVYVSKF